MNEAEIKELFNDWIEENGFYTMGYLQDNDQDWVGGAEDFMEFIIKSIKGE